MKPGVHDRWLTGPALALALTLALALVAAACAPAKPAKPAQPAPPAPDAAAAPADGPDRTAPALLDRRPRPDENDVWVFAPVSLTFSEPLQSSSVVPQAFELRAEGQAEPVAAEVRLGEDRRTVNVLVKTPPRGPARLTLAVAPGLLRDDAGNAYAGDRWSWQVPLWHEAGPPLSGGGASRPSAAVDRGGDLVVAWEAAEGARSAIAAARLTATGWVPLGGMIEPAPGRQALAPRLVATAGGPLLGWLERGNGSDVQVRRWDGKGWAPLGDAPPDGPIEADQPALLVDETGAIHVAFLEGERQVHVVRWDNGTWRAVAKAYTAPRRVVSYDFVLRRGQPVLAVSEKGTEETASADLVVLAWDGAGQTWRRLGSAASLDRVSADEVSSPRLAAGPGADGALLITWQEHDGLSDHVYVARFDQDWTQLGAALDLEIDAPAGSPHIRVAPSSGEPVVAWREGGAERAWSYVARWRNGRWQVLGAFASGAGLGPGLALALSDGGEPAVVSELAGSRSLAVRRFNGTPELPFGLPQRPGGAASPCRLPEEIDPNFPRTLSATGCFKELAQRTPVEGVLPYDLNSPLWSDGSIKRRFVVLPDGASFGYTEHDSWQTPPGTVFIKEFMIEREPGNRATLVPMETRFLVKRCEEGDCEMPWQGYSYQWNDAGTDAALLSNSKESVFKDWPTAKGMHRHTYPGQTQCGQCHLLASGGTLGIQTGQLNRSFNYGGGVVDNQLRALEHAGAFRRPDTGAGAAAADPEFAAAARVATPHDVGFSLERRVRGYFQGNCAHCHRPGGAWPVMDFRHQVPLSSSRLCELIKPGNATGSRLFIKSQTRDIEKLPDGTTGRPMPPLASLLLDDRQIVRLRTWIDGMKTCP